MSFFLLQFLPHWRRNLTAHFALFLSFYIFLLKIQTVRDLKFIWSEMENSFDFVKAKQVLSFSSSSPRGMISVPCKSDKKPKFMSRLRRFFYMDADCTRPDTVALQEVADVTASFVAAASSMATTTAAASNSSSSSKTAHAAAAAASRRASPHQWGLHSSSSLPAPADRYSNSRHHPHNRYQQLAASMAVVGGDYNPWAAATTVTASRNARPGHAAATGAAGAAVPNFFSHNPPKNDSQDDGINANNNNPRRRPHSQAFSSSATVAAASSYAAAAPTSGLEAMLRQFENETNNIINNMSSGAGPPPEQDGSGGDPAGGAHANFDEDDSRRPQNATEASILAELQAFGFTDVREVLEGIRRLTAKNDNNAPPSVDDVMVDLVTQREDLEHARQVDEARLASEALRKEEAQRRRASIAAELKERRVQAPLREWLSDFFCNSWILSTASAYDVLDKCMTMASNNDSSSSSNNDNGSNSSSGDQATLAIEFRDALFALLDTEKNSHQWYGKHLPRAYFTILVCKRLLDAGENAESLTKQLVVESETLKRELFTLSGKTKKRNE
jgi:hypothetical protein